LTSLESTSVKIGSTVLSWETWGQKKGKKTKKTSENDNSPVFREALTGEITLNFSVQGDIAVVIIHAKYYFNLNSIGFAIL